MPVGILFQPAGGRMFAVTRAIRKKERGVRGGRRRGSSDEAEVGAGHAAAGAGDAREKLEGTEDGKDPRERAEGQDARRVHNGEDKKKKGKG